MPKDDQPEASALKKTAVRGLRARFFQPEPVTKKRKAIALVLAAIADVVQLALLPAFVEGALSPFNDALDAIMVVSLLAILGFRWRLLFALGIELTPGFDLFPSWTAVVASVPTKPGEEAAVKARILPPDSERPGGASPPTSG